MLAVKTEGRLPGVLLWEDLSTKPSDGNEESVHQPQSAMFQRRIKEGFVPGEWGRKLLLPSSLISLQQALNCWMPNPYVTRDRKCSDDSRDAFSDSLQRSIELGRWRRWTEQLFSCPLSIPVFTSSTQKDFILHCWEAFGKRWDESLLSGLFSSPVTALWSRDWSPLIHNGDGLGFPATGKKTTFPGSSFITCRDGQLTEGRNFMDLTRMTLQFQAK
jgi:hypothetical protein